MKVRRAGRKLPVMEIAVVVSVLAIVAGFLGFARARSGSSDPTTPPGSQGASVVQKPRSPDQQHLTLFVDGWTQQIMRDAKPTYTAGPIGASAAKAGTPLVFTPVEDNDLGAIAERVPDILTRVAARMITVDPKLSCDATGCKTSAGKMPLTWFRTAADIPGFGTSYKAYGISSTLYKADVYVPTSANVFSISADGYQQIEYPVSKGKPAPGPAPSASASTAPGAEIAPDASVDTSGEQFAPDATNGYGRGWFLMAAGLGQFFTPQATWLGKTGSGPAMDLYQLGQMDEQRPAPDHLQQLLAEPPFAKGLAVPADAAKGMTASQLMTFTSPTVGCGVGVTCVPGKVDVTYTDVQPTDMAPVCLSDKSRPKEVGTVVFHTRRWTVTYPQPTHQYGVWDGKTSSKFTGARPGADGLYSGQPPLVSGKQTLRVTEAVIVTGADAKVFHVIGSVAQQGKDPASDFANVVGRDQLSKLERGMFTTC